mmetsp:Transcript_63910/g.202234  ORF Transcript_63910/g.202234 Transcript_63910/m.202234 type:complete len:214 (-) Transcript_63910:301-942(-)
MPVLPSLMIPDVTPVCLPPYANPLGAPPLVQLRDLRAVEHSDLLESRLLGTQNALPPEPGQGLVGQPEPRLCLAQVPRGRAVVAVRARHASVGGGQRAPDDQAVGAPLRPAVGEIKHRRLPVPKHPELDGLLAPGLALPSEQEGVRVVLVVVRARPAAWVEPAEADPLCGLRDEDGGAFQVTALVEGPGPPAVLGGVVRLSQALPVDERALEE